MIYLVIKGSEMGEDFIIKDVIAAFRIKEAAETLCEKLDKSDAYNDYVIKTVAIYCIEV